jgi:FkbM family methyltransferase
MAGGVGLSASDRFAMRNLLELLRARTRGLRHEVARWIYRSPALERGAVYSYSPFGEDRVVLGWLVEAGVKAENIRYLDIGASDPLVLNNTMLLYQCGGRGVLVEPDAEMAGKLKKRRGRDIVIDAAVAFDARRSAELIRMSSSVFNSFSERQVQHIVQSSAGWGAEQSVIERVEVALIPINEIIERHCGGVAPHFLSIDAESVDFEILQSLDFQRFRPWIICAESSRPRSAFVDLLQPFGYRSICETPHNFIFALYPLPKGNPDSRATASRAVVLLTGPSEAAS